MDEGSIPAQEIIEQTPVDCHNKTSAVKNGPLVKAQRYLSTSGNSLLKILDRYLRSKIPLCCNLL